MALIAIGAGTAVTAGAASAVTPISVPDGGVIGGLGFNHGETAALANSPIPSVLGMGLLAPITVAHVDDQSSIQHGGGNIYADMPTVWGEAAANPNGKMAVALVDPARWNGKFILVAQYL
ncbi:hypothetical protein [Nocardia nova]|uniref:hypothetical protein n=1 Tax=Nocardia nova TaxID=37330 RepID=UPI003410FDBA